MMTLDLLVLPSWFDSDLGPSRPKGYGRPRDPSSVRSVNILILINKSLNQYSVSILATSIYTPFFISFLSHVAHNRGVRPPLTEKRKLQTHAGKTSYIIGDPDVIGLWPAMSGGT